MYLCSRKISSDFNLLDAIPKYNLSRVKDLILISKYNQVSRKKITFIVDPNFKKWYNISCILVY